MDQTEQKVIATTYGTDINTIGDQLQLHKTYIISNAAVTLQESKYNIYNYPFQWTLKYFTKIRLERYDTIHSSILNYDFASLQGLGNYIGKKILIDILAVVIEKRGQHHVKIRGEQMLKKEYIIMNEERATVLLTFWNNIAMSEDPQIDNSNEMWFLAIIPTWRLIIPILSTPYDWPLLENTFKKGVHQLIGLPLLRLPLRFLYKTLLDSPSPVF
ncbi:hypothetical protein ACJIZ3_003665 [Penstemon smallii]|uniref:Uncharacterized protein n=1 Tax=Penstemon smallii TaxID=265156 RepID=A0ABD3UDA0_9LAMI